MCQLSDTEYLGEQKCIQNQKEIDLSGHFLYSSFELTSIEILNGQVQGLLTVAAYVLSAFQLGRFIKCT